MTDDATLLRVRDLRTYFQTDRGVVRAVDGVSFRIDRGETFALVGESGCGKSVTALAVLQLLDMPPARINSPGYLARLRRRHPARLAELYGDRPTPASITLGGRELLDLDEKQMRDVRGGQISMIFQEPMTSLNPVYTCGSQIVEAIRLHRAVGGREARDLAERMLARVGIPAPAQRLDEYPHQLSGGMRQRVMIAMALSCEPALLIADEPTTALDVTIQAQILDLLAEIQADRDLGILLITHDLAVVAESARRVGVMYASRLAELTDVKTLFAQPLHPYTRGLFRSLPKLGTNARRLETIPGTVPSPLARPPGCPFHPRCDIGRTNPRCRTHCPPLREIRPGHWCACWECPGYEDAPQTDPGENPKQ